MERCAGATAHRRNPVESVDLYVTLADLAGLKLPTQALGEEWFPPVWHAIS
jgi:arylsulfatase A-like enzyme